MNFRSSIKHRLVAIIVLVTTLTGIIGYSSFVYWYMNNQYDNALKQSKTLGYVLGQDIAKLILLNDISAAADITTKLKSFTSLNSTVLYKNDGTAFLQYSKDGKAFDVKPLPKDLEKSLIINNSLQIYTKTLYQDTNLGYVQLNFQVMTIYDILERDIWNLIFTLLVMLIISYLLASYFAKQFTSPIYKLIDFLDTLDFNKKIVQRVHTNERNEFKTLYTEVNNMLNRLDNSYSELKIASVAFETPAGIIITNEKQEILKVNKAFSKITGFEQNDVIGKKPTILSSGAHDKEFYDNMFNSLQKHNVWMGEIVNKHKNGQIVNEYLTIQTVLDDNGKIIYYVASFLDITFQKETENKLKFNETLLIQQSKMAAMGEMLSNIAHQWRQPLSFISSTTSGLVLNKELGSLYNTEEEKEQLIKINNTVQFLSNTIDDFRTFFIEDKVKKELNLKTPYKKALQIVSERFSSYDIKVIENFEDVEALILENEFIQVLMNILNNAKDELVKKELDKKLIIVSTYKEDDYVIFSIKDNAGGVPDNIIQKVFDPYFTTKSDSNGTGIGLYMSYEIISNHMNGKIVVENEIVEYDKQEYKGANFKIMLKV